MSTALAKRRVGLGRRRKARRNPGIAWGWLATGAALGVAYAVYNDTVGPGKAMNPTPAVIAYDALGLGGVGLAILGVAGGLMRHNNTTLAIGVVGGTAAFVAGTSLSIAQVGKA